MELLERYTGPDSYLNNIRKEGYVPGIIYGNDSFSQAIQINKKSLSKQLKNFGKSSIFTVDSGDDQIIVKINEIQKDPVTGEILHIDLQRVNLEKITYMTVPVHLFGQALGIKNGGTLQQQLREFEVKALPSAIPQSIHVNISELDIGDSLYVKDLIVPEDVEVLNDLNEVILTVLSPKADDEESNLEEPKAEPEIVNAKDGHGLDAAR